MPLQVEALTRGIRGDENTNWMLVWRGVEGVLHGLAVFVVHATVDLENALVTSIGVSHCGAEEVTEIAASVAVLGEDENA